MEAREITLTRTPIQLPGETRWTKADAAEWLRRCGMSSLHYRRESEHHTFFEQFEHHWDHEDYIEERFLLCPAPGVDIVYRKYPTIIKAAYSRDQREVAGGERWARCFRFYHAQKNYGRARKGEEPYSQRDRN